MELNESPQLEVSDKEIMVGEDLDLKSLIIKAIDKEDGDLKDKVVIDKGKFDNNKVGIYEIIYKLTDSKGASVTKKATVKVYEKNKKMKLPKTSISNASILMPILSTISIIFLKKRKNK